MTLRASKIRRRAGADTLSLTAEMAAAGLLFGFLPDPGMGERRYWHAIAATHGPGIDAKVAAELPGTRPGYRYALGEFPPVPLLGEPPAAGVRWWQAIDIEGVRFWKLGRRWQMSQAEHLREIGEVDGKEWKRFTAWRDRGFEHGYRCQASRSDRPSFIWHGCY